MTAHAGITKPAVVIDRVSVPFGTARGLTAVSLAIAAGERLVIAGPSGVGKTTLLRAIAGLAPVAAGTVHVAGRDVTSLRPEQRDAVYLHQSPVLFGHLTVGENVAFALRVRGVPAAEASRRVAEVLAAVQLPGMEPRPAHALSGGQRHRVALARAIAARPAVLLLDEPLSALDPALRDEVRGAIVAAQTEYHPAMIVVTHDLDDAGLLGDRVAVMIDGHIVQVAQPADLFARPATLAVARFLGLFQEIAARVDGNGGCARCVLGAVPSSGLNGDVVVVVRAEALLVVADGTPGAVAGTVTQHRHRARGSGIVVRVGDGSAGVDIEVARAPGEALPDMGSRVQVAMDPASALVFPAVG